MRILQHHLIFFPSLSARRAWIEINPGRAKRPRPVTSLSARRAWIEIGCPALVHLRPAVALRKESVDRNICRLSYANGCYVALRKESVDRNSVRGREYGHTGRSLSARRAWIEIYAAGIHDKGVKKSLSARRAWIEILDTGQQRAVLSLSLSARRAWIEISLSLEDVALLRSRSPQGERG